MIRTEQEKTKKRKELCTRLTLARLASLIRKQNVQRNQEQKIKTNHLGKPLPPFVFLKQISLYAYHC